jgi:hypothetical protein
VPGNDLDGRDDRQRVWDLPADEVLGDLGSDAPPAAAAAAPAGPAAAAPALTAAPASRLFCEARELDEGTRIIVVGDDGHTVTGTVLFVSDDEEDEGGLVIDYDPDSDAPPDSFRAQPGQHIRLAGPAGGGDGP